MPSETMKTMTVKGSSVEASIAHVEEELANALKSIFNVDIDLRIVDINSIEMSDDIVINVEGAPANDES